MHAVRAAVDDKEVSFIYTWRYHILNIHTDREAVENSEVSSTYSLGSYKNIEGSSTIVYI